MILNQWVSPYSDGHYPKLCPSGRSIVASGSSVVRVVNWQTGALLLEAKGRAPHWLTDAIVTYLEELGGDRDRRWEFNVDTGKVILTADDPALCAANEFSAGGGRWASYLATPRRIVVDGHILPDSHRYRGVSIGGGELVTSVDDRFLQIFDLTSLRPTRVVHPSGIWNQWRNCFGMVFHGYFGETFVAKSTQTASIRHTIAPWRAEGVAVACVGGGGRVWTATATEIAPRTKETRVGVLVRPLCDAKCLAVWDVEMNTIDMAYQPGRLLVAGASTTGRLVVLELDEAAPLKPVAWPTSPDRPFTQAIAWAGYHRFTGRADWPMKTILPFENCAIVTDLNGAVAAAGRAKMLVTVDNMAEVTPEQAGNVVGIYEGSEGTTDDINAYCRAARTQWSTRFPNRPVPPIVCYLQPRQTEAMAGVVPLEVDIFSPQFYFEKDETPPHIDYFQWMAWWMARLPADRLWMPTVQTYDRNFQWDVAQMAVLANQQGALISLARAYEHIIGFACFAVNRPGGLERHPELREALSRVGTVGRIGNFPSRWPYREIPSKPPSPKPDPKPRPGEDMKWSDLGTEIRKIPRDQIVRATEQAHEYAMANEDRYPHFKGGILIDGNAKATLDRLVAYIVNQWLGFLIADGSVDGMNADQWRARREAALSKTFKVLDAEQDPQ